MNLPKNTILFAILGLILLAAAWYLLFGKADTRNGVVGSGAVTSAEQTFIDLTSQIDPVAFDTSILTDTRFNVLQDIRTVIVEEPTGRTDPFAPLGGAAAK